MGERLDIFLVLIKIVRTVPEQRGPYSTAVSQ